jgi:hypothetical protein
VDLKLLQEFSERLCFYFEILKYRFGNGIIIDVKNNLSTKTDQNEESG